MSQPKLVQCLCPARHCILALAFREDVPDADAIAHMQVTIRAALGDRPIDETLRKAFGFMQQLNPWCGLCGAKAETWMYEVAILREQNWDKTVLELLESEQAQIASAEFLRRARHVNATLRGRWN